MESLDHLSSHVGSFIMRLHELFAENAAVLDMVGGNFMLHLGPMGTWVFVTRGPRFGIYDELTDDPVDCAVACAEGLLEAILRGEEVDLAEAASKRHIAVHGDGRVFDRFLGFAQGKNALALRIAG